MKKIKVMIMCAGIEEFPRASDLLGRCPEIAVLAQPGSLRDAGARLVLEQSDILILNEDAIQQEGADTIRSLHTSGHTVRSLLIMNNNHNINALFALSLGIQGVIKRESLPATLCRAVAAIYSGEAWVSRQLVSPLRDELIHIDRQVHWSGWQQMQPDHDKMH